MVLSRACTARAVFKRGAWKIQVADIHLVECSSTQFAVRIENVYWKAANELSMQVECAHSFTDIVAVELDGVMQIGAGGFQITDLRTFEPNCNPETLALHDLPKQQRVKGVRCRKNSSAEDRIAEVGGEEAAVDLYLNALKVLVNALHPNALKQHRRIKTHEPL